MTRFFVSTAKCCAAALLALLLASPLNAQVTLTKALDFDGDGRTDPATVRRQNGVMHWWILRSSDYGYNVYQWGLDTDYVAPGDYDGDGRFDIAIQHGGESSEDPAFWYLYQSTEGVRVLQFGQTNDSIVPGDYDGDGRTDIAVVREDPNRPDGLTWYIMPSSGGGSFYGIPWGLASTDVLTQGDYNGDGLTDLATWRDSTGTFWVLYSGTYGALAVKWGEPNDMPLAGYDTH